MKTIFTLTLMCVAFWLHAQNLPQLLWQKSLGGSFIDETRSICKNYKDGFMLAGFSLSSDGNINVPKNGNGWIAALDSAANIQWQFFMDADLQVINKSADSNYFIAGSKLVYHAAAQNTSYDFFIAKIDTAGNILWQKTYGGSAIDYAKSAAATNDGGYIITGYSQSGDDDVTKHYGSYALPDFWVIKLDKDGNLQWQKTLGGDGYDDAFSIQQTTDNNYIIAGRTNSVNGDITSSHLDNEFWLVKLNKDGNIIWQNTYGGNKSDIATQVVEADDGGFIAVGYSASFDGDAASNYGSTDVMIIKTDADGKLQWERSYGGSGDEFSYGLSKTPSGNYTIAASSNSNDFDLKDAHYAGNNYWVLLIDKQGNVIWQNMYGGNADDAAYSIINTTGEDYLIAGNSFSSDGDVLHSNGSLWDDIWLLKLHTTPEPAPFAFINSAATLNSNNAHVTWTSANESNIKYYNVQRSADNIRFKNVAQLTSLHNYTTDYLYTDSNVADKKYNVFFYRIAAVDTGDFIVYSSTDSIVIPKDSLPAKTLSLRNFKAVKNKENVDVQWKALHDTHLKYYSVERSTDGIAFTVINRMDSKRSDTLQPYIYTDKDLVTTAGCTKLYYRVAAVNDDGSAIYTTIDTVNLRIKNTTPVIHPFAFKIFKAVKTSYDANLTWQTLHESYIQFFNIQRSEDSVAFTTINQVVCARSDSGKHYFYTDKNVASSTGIIYYRIAAVNERDSVIYSNINIVRIKTHKPDPPVAHAFSIRIFPNPVADELNIKTDNYTGQLTAYITDIKGRLLLHQQANVSTNATISLPFSAYAAGVYFIAVNANGMVVKKKVIKK